MKRILSGVAVSALAMFGAAIGCMRPGPIETSNVELDVVNSCNAGDALHTIAPAVTCIDSVSSSSNDGAAIAAGAPRKSCGKWVVDCYLTGIKCSGSGTKKPLTCTAPEYAATNQAVNCAATWSQVLKGFQGTVEAAEDDSILSQPSPERAARLCSNKYSDLLTDINATANDMCNAAASKWTNESKKSAVCCIPAPKLDAGVPVADAATPRLDATMPSFQHAQACGSAGCGQAFADAGLPPPGDGSAAPPGDGSAAPPGDGSAAPPGDGSAAPGDGGTCSIDDPSLGDEPGPDA